jgi:hypothetical protein
MAFPDVDNFPETDLGPYERQMGGYLVGLLNVFAARVPDAESHSHVAELAAKPSRWSAAHATFDEIRARSLEANGPADAIRRAQYAFEESCCQAMYNAADPPDPFDPGSAFFVVPQALGLARLLALPLDAVADVFAPI